MLNIAIVGVGYWGPNLVRNMAQISDAKIKALVDLNQDRGTRVCQTYCSDARVLSDVNEVAHDPEIDAVVISTPIASHYDLGKLFLENNKHVFMEKPLTQTTAQAIELKALARAKGRVLFVGHVFLYNTAVRMIKKIVDQGELGDIHYIYSQRLNLGRIQNDINALWSLAPHDISMINYWMGKEPTGVSAQGFNCLNGGVEDVAFLVLHYPNRAYAHLHVSWLDPRKIRLMTIVGSKKMLVYDDVSTDTCIRIYDKGVDMIDEHFEAPQSFAQFQYKLRVGDIVIPALKYKEPLNEECRHFVDCCLNGLEPFTGADNGYSVVNVLENAQKSMGNHGALIPL